MLRRALAGAFAGLVRQVAAKERVVIALDSAHNADPDTLAVLSEVTGSLGEAPLVLLSAARPGWTHTWPRPTVEVQLGPFSAEESARFVSRLLGGESVDPAALDTLVQLGEGSPLVLEEVVRAYVEGGTLQRQNGVWQLTVPGALLGSHGLRSVVQARLDQLSQQERRVIQVLAVVGRSATASCSGTSWRANSR